MALCTSCSAPLPGHSNLCSYCGTRNDVDFAALNKFSAVRESSGRKCPNCGTELQTMRLCTDGSFSIERCGVCFGLFFDVNEVDAFLEAAVSPAFTVNYHEIAGINRERAGKEQIRYVQCPECGKLMNRVNFGTLSGVVVDQCKKHGVWLDNGEITHLMEWKKAGGQLLAEQKKMEQESQSAARPSGSSQSIMNIHTEAPGDDFLTAAFSLLSTIFR